MKVMNTFTSKSSLVNAIRQQIESSDEQAIKAMLRIYEYQTEEEKCEGTIIDFNGVGFAGVDAEIFTSFCEQYYNRGFLSPKQKAIIRKKIGKYAGQLVKHAINNGIYAKVENKWIVIKH